MMYKNSFFLFLIAAAFALSPVSAGGVRGGTHEKVASVGNTAAIDIDTTSDGCPLLEPETGSDCTGLIPAPFKYHMCQYRNLVCSCRNDSPFYLCNPQTMEPPLITAPIVPGLPQAPGIDSPVAETFECSDHLVSGSRCSTVGNECCVGGTSLCTCGSDFFFVCQNNDCGIEEPIVEKPDAEEPVVDLGIPIPDYVDFSFNSLWCPRNLTNCEPCAEFLPDGEFNESCNADTTISYRGESVSVQVQCRCFSQDNQDPTWQCRYIEAFGDIIPLSPSCDTEPTANPAVAPVSNPVPELPAEPITETPVNPIPEPITEETPITGEVEPIQDVPSQPVLITEIPPTTECLDRLPTSGMTTCQIPAGEICCHNVQFAIASVCTCEAGLFQCRDGVPSDCPDEQNPNVIALINAVVP